MDAILSTTLNPPDACVRVEGDLDLAECDELARRLDMVCTAVSGPVTVDLAGVTFVDCTCLRVLDRARRRLAAEGRCLVLVGASARFTLVCRLARYEDLAALLCPSAA